jgi:hypothetical protein
VEIDAELVEWSLVRVTMGQQVSTHAVGLRTRELMREAAYVLTSPVREVDRDRRLLTTQNHTYELVRPMDDYPQDFIAHHVWLIANRAKTAPDRIEWIRFDGSVGKSMDQAEIVATVEAWHRAQDPRVRGRVEAVMAAKGHANRRSKAGPSF